MPNGKDTAELSPGKFHGIAVDVGNSAIHVGRFEATSESLQPSRAIVLDNTELSLQPLEEFLAGNSISIATWRLASVNDRALQSLTDWLNDHHPSHGQITITAADCPIRVDVPQPDAVGIDRLMAAVAADAMRSEAGSAIVIDAGTAITVDCLEHGIFRGGAILPGMRMAAAALDRYTEKLPLVATDPLASPPAVGQDTAAAISSGIFWGTAGALQELIKQMSGTLAGSTAVFITGGDGKRLAAHVAGARFVPHMVLSGIALAQPTGASDA